MSAPTYTADGIDADRATHGAASASRTAGTTLWLTGLPSAGKTTLAFALAERLQESGRDVEILDGDEIRTYLSAGLGFSREDRDTHVRRVGFVAELLARHGVLVLVPVIAPYADTRAEVRALHEQHGSGYLEVHLSTPVDVCSERDVKGLYAKAARGEVRHMTGVDDPYEIPAAPDLRIDTSVADLQSSVDLLLDLLAERTPR